MHQIMANIETFGGNFWSWFQTSILQYISDKLLKSSMGRWRKNVLSDNLFFFFFLTTQFNNLWIKNLVVQVQWIEWKINPSNTKNDSQTPKVSAECNSILESNSQANFQTFE